MKTLTTGLLITLITSSANAATLEVPHHFGTIQAAINAANPHDVIEIAGGTYFEDLRIAHKTFLTLRPRGGDKVYVDAGGTGYPLVIDGGVVSDIVIKRIEFQNTSNCHGVWIGNAAQVKLEKCVITNVGWDGVYVTHSSDVTLKKCQIFSPGRHGISSDFGGLRATQNTIMFPSGSGILLKGGLNSAVNNQIMSPALNGIQLGDGAVFTSNNLVQGNEITLAGQDGIQCRDNVVSCTISENKIGKAQDDGVHLYPAANANIVMNNSISRCQDAAIEVESDSNSIRSNKIKKPGVDGIWIGWNADTNTFQQNKVAKSNGDGVDVWGVNNRFLQNRAFKSADFDLNERTLPFSNTYIGNSFGTVSP